MKRTSAIPHAALRVGRAKSGLGLFAAKPLTPGMFLEYVGDIITTEEADRKTGARYLFELNSKWTIDGSARTNIARYINHACKPNCESRQTGKRIFITVLKPIAVGEELCYDYGEEYVDEFIRPVGCKCHACERKHANAQRTVAAVV